MAFFWGGGVVMVKYLVFVLLVGLSWVMRPFS